MCIYACVMCATIRLFIVLRRYFYRSSNKINSSLFTSLTPPPLFSPEEEEEEEEPKKNARNEVFVRWIRLFFYPQHLVFSSYGAYGKRNTGSAHPNIVNAVFTPIGFGSLNNHRMRGIKSSRSFRFGFWRA